MSRLATKLLSEINRDERETASMIPNESAPAFKSPYTLHNVDAAIAHLGKPCIMRFQIFGSVSCSRPVAISVGKRESDRHIRGES